MKHELLPIHLIQTFVVFVEATNITEAAGRLDISQPAVSVHLKRFEELLPQPVFIKVGKRKQLGPYGRTLYKKLSQGYHRLQSSISEANQSFALQKKQFKVAGTPELFPFVSLQNSDLKQIQFLSMTEEDAHHSLKEDKVQVAIVRATHPRPPFHSKLILEDSWTMCAHKNLASRASDLQSLDWQEQHRFVLNQNETEFAEDWLELNIEKARIDHSQCHSARNWLETFQLIQAQVGFGVLPTRFARLCHDLQLSTIEFSQKEKFYALGREESLELLSSGI